jgi:hypothetical protein
MGTPLIVNTFAGGGPTFTGGGGGGAWAFPAVETATVKILIIKKYLIGQPSARAYL